MLIFLTQDSGKIIGPISKLFGFIMDFMYNVFSGLGIINLGIIIIIFTFITRAIMIPLTVKQQKFARLSSKMNPELTKVQSKYKNKKDPDSIRKQQAETQEIYAKYGVSPTASCLPLLIQLPVMFALYRVVNNIPAYVEKIKILYSNIVVQIQTISGYDTIISEFAEEKRISLEKMDILTNQDHIIDILARFNSSDWSTFVDKFNNHPDIVNVINANTENIIKANTFFGGINISDAPGLTFPGIIIPLMAVLTQYVATKLMSSNTNNTQANDSPMAASMKSMNVVMPLMSGFFCINFPAGVGLYWIAGSLFQIIQQFFVNKYMDKLDIDDIIDKNADKVKKRNEKLGIDPKKSLSENIKGPAKTKSEKSISDYASTVKKENVEKSNNYEAKQGSISSYANLLKNKDYKDKGDK